MSSDRMRPQRLASVLDTGEEPILDWPNSPPPAVRAAAHFALHLLVLVVVFLAVLVGAGAAMHALRGPHHHGCGGDTRGTCTEPR